MLVMPHSCHLHCWAVPVQWKRGHCSHVELEVDDGLVGVAVHDVQAEDDRQADV